jgi:hypothetical protein
VRRDLGRQLAHHREAVGGVPDRRLEDLAEPQRPEVAHELHPAVERTRYDRGQDPLAGHEVEAGVALQGRGRGGRSLCAQHPRCADLGAPEHHRQIAARAVLVRLDDLQHEPGRHGRVECVAAALEHPHARGRRQPMGGGHHAERAAKDRTRCGCHSGTDT